MSETATSNYTFTSPIVKRCESRFGVVSSDGTVPIAACSLTHGHLGRHAATISWEAGETTKGDGNE